MINWKLRSFCWGGAAAAEQVLTSSYQRLARSIVCAYFRFRVAMGFMFTTMDGGLWNLFFTLQLPTTPPPLRPKPICLSSEIKKPLPVLLHKEPPVDNVRAPRLLGGTVDSNELYENRPQRLVMVRALVRVFTWVSDAPRWSLCSSWWSSLSPAEPSRWSRPLATGPAITARRAHGRLNTQGAEK